MPHAIGHTSRRRKYFHRRRNDIKLIDHLRSR
jgi:hypothetical protein